MILLMFGLMWSCIQRWNVCLGSRCLCGYKTGDIVGENVCAGDSWNVKPSQLSQLALDSKTYSKIRTCLCMDTHRQYLACMHPHVGACMHVHTLTEKNKIAVHMMLHTCKCMYQAITYGHLHVCARMHTHTQTHTHTHTHTHTRARARTHTTLAPWHFQ